MNCAQDTQDKNQTLRESFFVNFISFVSCNFTVKVCFKLKHLLGEFTPILIYIFGWPESINEIFYASLHVTATKKTLLNWSWIGVKFSFHIQILFTIFWIHVYKLAVNCVSLKIIFLAQRINPDLLNCHFFNI